MKTRAQHKSRSATLMTAMMLLIGSTTLFSAQAGSLPRSALPGVQAIDTIEHREMPTVDIHSLLAEDVERENSGTPVAPRFAKNIPVDYTPDNSGTWETLEDGSRLWRLRLSSAGALSLNLGLEHFDLPEDADVLGSRSRRLRGPGTVHRARIAMPSAASGPPSSSATKWWPSYGCRKTLKRISESLRSTTDTGSSANANPPSTPKGARATSTSFVHRVTHGATRSGRSRVTPCRVRADPRPACARASSSTTLLRTSLPIF